MHIVYIYLYTCIYLQSCTYVQKTARSKIERERAREREGHLQNVMLTRHCCAHTGEVVPTKTEDKTTRGLLW